MQVLSEFIIIPLNNGTMVEFYNLVLKIKIEKSNWITEFI